MGDTIHCPECGSDDVVCTKDPHNHECRACGYSLLGGVSTLPNIKGVAPALRSRLEEDATANGRTLSQSVKFLLEQAVGLRPPPAPGPVPMVLSNEDGDTWWAKGHVPAAAMVLGVVLEQMVCLGPEEAAEVLTNYSAPRWPRPDDDDSQPPPEADQRSHADGLLATVEHLWMVQDPDNEEHMLKATADADGASPWTRLAL